MKKLIFITLIMLIGFSAISQNDEEEYRTLFNKGRTSHGAYGGLSINYSQMEGKDALIVGARGGWIIDHGFSIGFAGYGFANDFHYNDIPSNTRSGLVGGYGGLLLESIILPNSPIHLSIPLLIGVGGVSYGDNWDFGYDFWDRQSNEADAFFVIEPGVELELNLIKFMRISAGVYYRHTSNIQLQNTDKHALNGLSTGITLKFGKF